MVCHTQSMSPISDSHAAESSYKPCCTGINQGLHLVQDTLMDVGLEQMTLSVSQGGSILSTATERYIWWHCV